MFLLQGSLEENQTFREPRFDCGYGPIMSRCMAGDVLSFACLLERKWSVVLLFRSHCGVEEPPLAPETRAEQVNINGQDKKTPEDTDKKKHYSRIAIGN
jgi:hypothetical protein